MKGAGTMEQVEFREMAVVVGSASLLRVETVDQVELQRVFVVDDSEDFAS
jgi:hypothetical protein